MANRAFMNHNLAFERYPWPFDNKCFEMDIDAIKADIKLKKEIENGPLFFDIPKAKRARHKPSEKE